MADPLRDVLNLQMNMSRQAATFVKSGIDSVASMQAQASRALTKGVPGNFAPPPLPFVSANPGIKLPTLPTALPKSPLELFAGVQQMFPMPNARLPTEVTAPEERIAGIEEEEEFLVPDEFAPAGA